MSKNNDRVWANYDNWKLASPPEDNYPEVFETDTYLEQSWFSIDEDIIEEFNKRAIKSWKGDYDSYEDFIYSIVDELELCTDEEHVLVTASENERDAYEAAQEYKAEMEMERRRGN